MSRTGRRHLSNVQIHVLCTHLEALATDGKISGKPGPLAETLSKMVGFEVGAKSLSRIAHSLNIELEWRPPKPKLNGGDQPVDRNSLAEISGRCAAIETSVSKIESSLFRNEKCMMRLLKELGVNFTELP